MAEKSNGFWAGFWLGTLVGGITSALVLSRLGTGEDSDRPLGDAKANETNPELSGEDLARRNLEQKIAQLNAAIDAVSKEINQASESVPRSPVS
jgi:hypothetical protein